MAGVKTALRDLARRWKTLDEEIKTLNRQIEALVRATAPALVELHGVGVELAGQFLVTAGDNAEPHPQRSSLRQTLRCRTTACQQRTNHRPSPAQPRR